MAEPRLNQKQYPKIQNEEDQMIVYVGANITQLSQIFNVPEQQIRAKLADNDVKPDGVRRGVPIWKIKNAAPYIVKPMGNMQEYLQNASPNDLPPKLTKEFWAGMRAKQEYEVRAGQLWHTTEVIKKVSALMKLVKQSAQLFSDSVERTTELTDRQKKILEQLKDAMLNDLHKKVLENFSQPALEEGGKQAKVDSDEDF